jgi:hypothetical protein
MADHKAIAVAKLPVRFAASRRLSPGLTNQSLRRTFCAVLYEAGATPAYVMSQMGYASASLALEIYTKVMERDRDTGARTDALLRGACPDGAVGADGPETADQGVDCVMAGSALPL